MIVLLVKSLKRETNYLVYEMEDGGVKKGLVT